MRYIRLGDRGPKISVIGLGFWQAGSRLWGNRGGDVAEKVYVIVGEAYNYGINFYDTAEIYGGGLSEKCLGEAIRRHGIRDEVVVASKVAGYRWIEHSILKAIKRINNRIGFKIDLIQHHWPPPLYAPICKVINALEKAVDRGMVEYYGLSNYNTNLLIKAIECSRKYEPISNQVQYSLAYRVVENRLKKYMEEMGISLIAWSPLAKGALAGLRQPKTLAQKTDPVFRKASTDNELQGVLRRLADKYKVSKSVIALSWLISMKAIPIPGTRRPKRVREYARAGELRLSGEDLELLDRASRKYLRYWGVEYSSLSLNRLIPGFLQQLGIALIRGI